MMKRLSSIGLGCIALCFLLTLGALLFPFLSAFGTAGGGKYLEGAIRVENAFSFIFSLEATSSITVGVGSVITEIPGPSLVPSVCLYPLLGYCFLLASTLLFVPAFFLPYRHRFFRFALCFLLASFLLAGSVLILLSGQEVFAAFFGMLQGNQKEAMDAMGFRLGDGFLWSGIFGLMALPFAALFPFFGQKVVSGQQKA